MNGIRTGFIYVILVLISVSCTTKSETTEKFSDDENRPNIIMILADDLGYSDIGCFGSEISTPNLDKLAENGIRFTQVYNTSKCFPSRASLLTGSYAHQVGMGSKHEKIENALTLGEALKLGGYRTLWSGKHHGTENPVTRGFDRYYGLRDGACNHFNPGWQRPGEGKPARKRSDRAWCIDDQLYEPYTPEYANFYTTDYFTNYALNWLEEYKDDQQPFFLYLSYTAPHDPLMAWPEDIAKYEGKYIEGYDAIRTKRFQKQKESGLLGNEYKLPEAQHENWESLSEDEKLIADRKMAVYAAMIDRLDQNIGRVIQKIKDLGEEENTLILFASDNGASAEVVTLPGSGEIGEMTRWTSLGPDWANVGNTPLRYYKNYSYEGGIRTPLIAYWPEGIGIEGSISTTPLHFIDFMPTFLELAGVEYPNQYDGQPVVQPQGVSFVPALKGEPINRNKPLFWQWSKGKAIREGDWKLVSWDGEWELYNLKDDPSETEDMSNSNPGKKKELVEKYNNWATETGIIQ